MTLTRQGLLAGLFATAALIALPVQAEVKLAAPASVGMSAEGLKGIDQAMHGLVDQGRLAGVTTLVARHGKEHGSMRKLPRLLLGLTGTVGMMVPFFNLIVPVLATAAAVHMAHSGVSKL